MTDYTPTTVTVADVYATANGLPEAPQRRAWFYRWFDTEIQAAKKPLLTLLEELVDPDPCWFDHHGGCQAHGYLWLEQGQTCPHQDAKRLIAAEKEDPHV